jgi:hypothetical protein
VIVDRTTSFSQLVSGEKIMPCGCATRRDAIVKAAHAIADGDTKALEAAVQSFAQSVATDASRVRAAALARLGAGRR